MFLLCLAKGSFKLSGQDKQKKKMSKCNVKQNTAIPSKVSKALLSWACQSIAMCKKLILRLWLQNSRLADRANLWQDDAASDTPFAQASLLTIPCRHFMREHQIGSHLWDVNCCVTHAWRALPMFSLPFWSYKATHLLHSAYMHPQWVLSVFYTAVEVTVKEDKMKILLFTFLFLFLQRCSAEAQGESLILQ